MRTETSQSEAKGLEGPFESPDPAMVHVEEGLPIVHYMRDDILYEKKPCLLQKNMPSFADVERYWSSVLRNITNIFVSNFIELLREKKPGIVGDRKYMNLPCISCIT